MSSVSTRIKWFANKQVAKEIARDDCSSASFLDPTGRRWRRFRFSVTVALAVVVGGLLCIPKMYAAPALPHTPTTRT